MNTFKALRPTEALQYNQRALKLKNKQKIAETHGFKGFKI